MTCRYETKRTFRTRDKARMGIKTIRYSVEGRGIEFNTLYPFHCPDEDHWHLSHYRQGYQDCPGCGERMPFFTERHYWVIPTHGDCGHQTIYPLHPFAKRSA